MNTAAAVQPPADAVPEHLADEEAFRVAERRMARFGERPVGRLAAG